MPCDAALKAAAEKRLQVVTWQCAECGGQMPLEYEEDPQDETGYRIVAANCDDCSMRYDETINNEYGKKLDECSTRELLEL